jgi:hypothetical protein
VKFEALTGEAACLPQALRGLGLLRAYTDALAMSVVSVRMMGGHLISLGDTVRFRTTDIFLPLADELPSELMESSVLEGTIRSFSDSSQKPRVFAVVEVVLRRSVVVPVVKLQVVEAGSSESH